MQTGPVRHIAFDLDDTLIDNSVEGHFPAEPHWLGWLLRLLGFERLRCGTVMLFRDLYASGLKVSIYTTSHRSPFYIRLLFRLYWLKLWLVINRDIHLEAVSRMTNSPTKHPKAFGIDLLVDDLPGVAQEGLQYGFKVLQINPDDIDWVDKVKSAIH